MVITTATVICWILLIGMALAYVYAIFKCNIKVVIAVIVVSVVALLITVSFAFVLSAAIGVGSLAVIGIRKLFFSTER